MKSLLLSVIASATVMSTAYAAEVGKTAPAFTAKTAAGNYVSLSDYKDKTVVLEWVNFDCPFVKKHYSSKNMQNLQAAYTAKDIVWLTINSSAEGKQGHLTGAEFTTKAEEMDSKSSSLLLDSDGKIGKAYGAKVTPHLMIINKQGNLAYSGAIDSKKSVDTADIQTSDPLFANALDAVIAGQDVPNAFNKPYGCGVKY